MLANRRRKLALTLVTSTVFFSGTLRLEIARSAENHVNGRMSGRNKAVLINVCIVGTLVWYYYSGYPLIAIVISGFVLLTIANVLMYVKHRRRR
jgi:hypothetical protein